MAFRLDVATFPFSIHLISRKVTGQTQLLEVTATLAGLEDGGPFDATDPEIVNKFMFCTRQASKYISVRHCANHATHMMWYRRFLSRAWSLPPSSSSTSRARCFPSCMRWRAPTCRPSCSSSRPSALCTRARWPIRSRPPTTSSRDSW